jgi:hypothetical protein
MSSGGACTLAKLAAFVAILLPVSAQSVISTHSGLIHFFEGAVYLGDQSLESHLGRFPSVPQGAELRTVEGRAEVLLTPGVFLRMGDRSAIRMVANDLADTQVELETGSVIVDSGEPNLNTSVTLIYKNWRVHFLQKGAYRVDADPPRLWVRQGQAEVFSGVNEHPISVEHGMNLPFASVLVPEQAREPSQDALSDWSIGRGESITADNAITAQLDQDPTAGTPGLDSFTYYPFLGLSSLGMNPVGSYGSYFPLQPGFSSIYLPGYTYRPLLLGTMGLGPIGHRFPTYPLSFPRVGVSPGAGYINPLPRVGVGPGAGRITPLPRVPVARPGTTHAPPAVGARGGAHR